LYGITCANLHFQNDEIIGTTLNTYYEEELATKPDSESTTNDSGDDIYRSSQSYMGYQESADFMSDMCRIIRFYVFGQQQQQHR